MKKRIISTVLLVLLGMLTVPASRLLCAGPQAGADAGPGEQVPAPQTEVAMIMLKTILESVDELKNQVNEKEEELERAKTEDQKARVLKELADDEGCR